MYMDMIKNVGCNADILYICCDKLVSEGLL